MKKLTQYLKNVNEAFGDELNEITGWLGSLENLSDVLDRLENSKILGGRGSDRFGRGDGENIDDHTKRYVGMILKKLMMDPEIISWYDSPYNNEMELYSLLAKKLSPREMTYLEEITQVLASVEDSDKDAEIVNNAVVRLIDDPDLERWFKKYSKPIKKTDRFGNVETTTATPNEFELRKIINSKLSGTERKFSEPIARKFMRIYSGEYDTDDYFNGDRGSSGMGRSMTGRRSGGRFRI
jgi:hypothetical protein